MFIIAGTTVLKGYQTSRITTWLDPLSDPYNTSQQLVNALIAFKNGGLFGLGLGNSTQKYGYIPKVAQMEVSEYLKIPMAEIYGVITFYSRFTLDLKVSNITQ